MPDVDSLMQEWPTQFEELLKEVSILIFSSIIIYLFKTSVPPADVDVDLATYTDIACCM